MANQIKLVKNSMDEAVAKLNTAAKNYESDGAKFVSAFKAAIDPMQGAAKDALEEFFTKNVEGFVTTELPGAVSSLASLLASNASNFDDVDAQLAQSISGNGGGN